MRILIVEDEIIEALGLSTQVEGLGHRICDMVTSGEDAILVARSHRPDLILMDINLRGDMSGIDTAMRLREFDIPVIFITSYRDESLRRQAIRLKPIGYINKPVNFEILRQMIGNSRVGRHCFARKNESAVKYG